MTEVNIFERHVAGSEENRLFDLAIERLNFLGTGLAFLLFSKKLLKPSDPKERRPAVGERRNHREERQSQFETDYSQYLSRLPYLRPLRVFVLFAGPVCAQRVVTMCYHDDNEYS